MIHYGRTTLGEGAPVFEPVTLGFPSREFLGAKEYQGTTIGRNAVLRTGTIISCNVTIGDNFSSGHNVMIREHTTIGDDTAIGTETVSVPRSPRGPYTRSSRPRPRCSGRHAKKVSTGKRVQDVSVNYYLLSLTDSRSSDTLVTMSSTGRSSLNTERQLPGDCRVIP